MILEVFFIGLIILSLHLNANIVVIEVKRRLGRTTSLILTPLEFALIHNRSRYYIFTSPNLFRSFRRRPENSKLFDVRWFAINLRKEPIDFN